MSVFDPASSQDDPRVSQEYGGDSSDADDEQTGDNNEQREQQRALLRSAATVEYADDRRAEKLAQIAAAAASTGSAEVSAAAPSPQISSPARRATRASGRRSATGNGDEAGSAAAAAASPSMIAVAAAARRHAASPAQAAPSPAVSEASASSRPSSRSQLASPAPAAASGASSGKLSVRQRTAIRAAAALAKAIGKPAEQPPAAPPQAQQEQKQEEKQEQKESQQVQASEPNAGGGEVDMTSPEVPAIPAPASDAPVQPAAGDVPFPALESPQLRPPAAVAAAGSGASPAIAASQSRPLAHVSSPFMGTVTQDATQATPSTQRAREQATSARGRPRKSALDDIQQAQTQQQQAAGESVSTVAAAPAAPVAAATTDAVSSHKHRSHRHKHSREHGHEADGSSHRHSRSKQASADGAGAASSSSHRHRSHSKKHSKRTHSRSSSSGASSGAEDQQQSQAQAASRDGDGSESGSHKKHKKKKHKKHKREGHATNAGGVRVKAEPVAAGAAAAVVALSSPPPVPGSSFATPLLPETEDEMWDVHASLKSAGAAAMALKPTRMSKQALRAKEVSLRDASASHRRATAHNISSVMGQIADARDVQQQAEAAAMDVENFPEAAGGERVGGAGHPRRPELELHETGGPVTPPRAQRLSAKLQSEFGDDVEDDEAAADGGRGGSGAFSSGERGRGGKKKLGTLELQLQRVLVHSKSVARKHNASLLNQHAALVGGSHAPPPLLDNHSIIVRVLWAQARFGSRWAMCLLCSRDIDSPDVAQLAPPTTFDPLPIPPASVAELSRVVARSTQHFTHPSVPYGLLRMVMFPDSDMAGSTGGHGSSSAAQQQHYERLSDFPNCYLRLSAPFSLLSIQGRMPLILGVREWSRLSGAEEAAAIALEKDEWKKESERAQQQAATANEEERLLANADAIAAARGVTLSLPLSRSQSDELGGGGGGAGASAAAMADIVPLAPRRSKIPEPTQSHTQYLPEAIAKHWPIECLSHHPDHSTGQSFHEEISRLEKEGATIPLVLAREWTDPAELLVQGVVQKVLWRGVNIQPNEAVLQSMLQVQADSRDEASVPSFILQDASGSEIEVEVPLALLATQKWGRLLLHAQGRWVQLLQLRKSSRRSGRMRAPEGLDSMQRALQPWRLAGKPFTARSWLVFSASVETAFLLRDTSNLADDSLPAAVRRSAAQVTPLLHLAKVSSIREAESLNRVTLLARVVHLDNHARTRWMLYLSDESLVLAVSREEYGMGASITSSLMVLVTSRHIQALIDTFIPNPQTELARSSADREQSRGIGPFKLIDVRVTFDPTRRTVELVADDFTEFVKCVEVRDTAFAQVESQKPLVRQSKLNPIRRVNPFTSQLHMLPQQVCVPLRPAKLHDWSLEKLLCSGGILTPLVQRHAVFTLPAIIAQCNLKPTVTPCCKGCQNQLLTDRGIAMVCHHCGRSNDMSASNPGFWLHQVVVHVALPYLAEGRSLADGAHPTDPLYPVQLESAELQDLTSAVDETRKALAFRSAKEFHEMLHGTCIQFRMMFSSKTHQSSPIDMRSHGAADLLALQVPTRPAALVDDGLSQLAESQAQESQQPHQASGASHALASQSQQWASQRDEEVFFNLLPGERM